MISHETRILVVDDQPSMRQIVKGQLRELGYRIICDAENGKSAWDLLHIQDAKNEPVGLILSDWSMPEMTGLELLKSVRASDIFKNVPFILITAEDEKKQVLEAIKAGVNQYIVKPFQPNKLKEKIDAIIVK